MALQLVGRLGLGPRIAARHTAERLCVELGRRGGLALVGARQRALRREAGRLALAREAAAIAADLGLPLVLLKGGALSASGATAPGSRAAGDLDVLVPAERTHELGEALQAAGYRKYEPIPARPNRHHVPPLVDSRGHWIEIHRRMPGVRAPGSRRFLTFARLEGGGWLEAAPELGPAVKLPTRQLLAAHAVAHCLIQHRFYTGTSSPLRVVSDLIDLDPAGDRLAQLEAAYRFVARDLAQDEVRALGRLCLGLERGDGRLFEEPGLPEGRLLRHMVASTTQEAYAESLRRRAFLHPVVEGSPIPTIGRSLVAMALPGIRPWVWRTRVWRRALREWARNGRQGADRWWDRARRALGRVARLDGSLRLRLDLTRVPPPAAAGLVVRELPREQVEAELAMKVSELDRVAPGGWRCFVATRDHAVLAHGFVQSHPASPLLFRVFTHPEHRGRRRFRTLVWSIAAQLRWEGERTLSSSTRLGNRSSVRAHRAAGFVVEARRLDVVLFGHSLRRLAGRARGTFLRAQRA